MIKKLVRLTMTPILVGGAFLVGGCTSEQMAADTILVGGKIWTATDVDADWEAGPTAVAVSGGRIVAVGSDEEIEAFASSSTKRIELSGRRVVPGFIDNHTHFISSGFELNSVKLRDAQTPDEFSLRIGEYASQNPGEWVTGGTWDHENWGGELPRRDWIDSLTGDTPVFVTRLDGHMSLANSAALELAAITAETAEVDGGTIVRDEEGVPTGILKDAAQSLVYAVMPEPGEEALDRALDAAVQYAVERGVTLATDMGSWGNLAAYRRALEAGRLKLRMYSVVPLATWERLRDFVQENGRGDDRLYWGGVKAFVDGSLGSTTAWFYEPYDDEPETSGLVITDLDELRSNILAADAAELHVMVHAIGDRANDWLLDVFEAAAEENGFRDRRFRIEHAQHLSEDAIRRFAEMGVAPSMQPYHAIDDGRWAEKRIGPERILTTYAFRSLLDEGAALTFGSDWSVAPIDPLLGIYAAVTRRTIDGANPGGWVPDQRITVAEAVRSYTEYNAWASYRYEDLGKLEAGRYADLVVLSGDIFEIAPNEIEGVRVDITMVEGEVVFERR
ncbi:MAG: amidohydrolase [Gemmatimonadota bacterium]|nr:amidohydrolase [Gemmatimonadota bacterium]